jgi:aconitate hydratase
VFSVSCVQAWLAAKRLTVRATAPGGAVKEFAATVRIDTPQEAEYYRHGGILEYVLRDLAQAP